ICGSFYDKFQLIEAVGASGGLLTCWSSLVFSCSEAYLKQYSITIQLTHTQSGSSFYVTNVYGPPTWEGKEEFCTELAHLKGICKGCWVLCGDFNFTREANWNAELLDLPMKNQAFMWLNMQNHPTLAKLDRFLISTEWDQQFPMSNVEAVPRITSDHCPILLSTGDKPKRKLFRLKEVWLRNEDFIKRIPVWWREVQHNDSALHSLNAKLRHCRKQIKKWCASNFYNI
ncbi:hypothetical protein ACMD2_08310, partial [Ananas comosus]